MAILFGKQTAPVAEDHSGAQLVMPASQRVITEEDVRKATGILKDYKAAKADLESRVIEDELWWKLRHWEAIRKTETPEAPEPASAWLFNSICNKHADAMDNYPEPNVLPRERSDEQEAQTISSILPCVLEAAGFEDTYSANWWEKLKHGTGGYFIGWDPEAENGLGDVDIHMLDLMDVYWEPGISDIQDSRNLFIVSMADTDIMEQRYPEYKGKLNSPLLTGEYKYVYDTNVKTEDKTLVIDWYYKVKSATGRQLVHYVKYCGDCILFSSENYTAEDGTHPYQERGYYDHGMYPVKFDTMYPEKGTPVGFGMIAITKSPQLYIDKLSSNILEHSYLGTKQRYIASASADINEDELKDANVPVVHSALSQLDDLHLKPIPVSPLETNYLNVLTMKTDELKETSANRDFTNGGTSSGVTAAAAIAALQEAGNKISRDMIQASYRNYKGICEMVIELIRQFYTESRSFRITGDNGKTDFVDYNNAGIQDQTIPAIDGVSEYVRRPVFDLKIKPQKRSPFSIEAQYERAKELYAAGFFNPQKAQESMIALTMMDFEGKDKVLQQVQQGQTLYNVVQQLMMRIAALEGPQVLQSGGTQSGSTSGSGQTIAGAQQAATNANRTAYMEKTAANSKPTMSQQNGVRAQ